MIKQMAHTFKILAGREKTFPAFFVVGYAGFSVQSGEMSLSLSCIAPTILRG